MKVMVSVWSAFPFHGMAGIDKYPYYLCKYLLKEGVQAEIVTSAHPKGITRETYDGITYRFLPPNCVKRKFLSPWVLWFSANLACYLRKQQFDVLHSFTDTAYCYLHLRQRKPAIIQPFNLEPFRAPSFLEPRGLKKVYLDLFSRHPWRYCLTRADAVAAEGEFEFNDLTHMGIKRERLFSLPIGADLSLIDERLRSPSSMRKEVGFHDGDLVLLSVNRYSPDAGFNYAIEALQLIRQQVRSARLIVIGKAKLEAEKAVYTQVVNLVANRDLTDAVTCLTDVPEAVLWDYFALADVYVLASIRPARQVQSVIEAMACRLPVVSTGQEDLVKEGVNGYVVPRRDPRAIAEAVMRIYREGRGKEMGVASRRIVEDYDMAAIARRAIEQYRRMVSGG